MQPRHSYVLSIFEKLGSPLLAAVTETTERDRMVAAQNGQKNATISTSEEADRIASLLKSSAEMGFALSRQVDLRMIDVEAADGVRLALATIAAPLMANLYRVNGRVPATSDIDRMTSAMQAVTLFADNYNAAADANVRLQTLEQDFAPADGAQVQLMLIHALMPAMNAVCTFSFGQSEKTLMQSVMDRLRSTAQGLSQDMFGEMPERDALRAELSLLRAAAMIYSQAHYTEMSKLMFMDETERDGVDLNTRLNELWQIVDTRLSMMRTLSQVLAFGEQTSVGQASAGSVAPVAASAPATAAPAAKAPLSAFASPVQQQPTQPVAPVAATPTATAPAATKANPMSAFTKPKESAGG